MNGIERFVHARVEHHPRLHRSVVRAYQFAMSIVPYRECVPENLVEHPGLFFGFHDKSPWSPDGDLALAHRFASNATKYADGVVEIGTLQPGRPGSFRSLGRTALWNWQQGSELQWRGPHRQVVFNTIAGDRPIARVVDCDGSHLFDTRRPVSAVSRSGSEYLAFDFGRLAAGMKGYGYESAVSEGSDEPRLILGSFDTGQESVVFSGDATSSGDHVFLSHCTFGPGDGHLAFYRRATSRSGRMRTELWVRNGETGRAMQVDLSDCSHYAWLDERHLIAYCKPTERPVWGYHRIDVVANSSKRLEWLDQLPDGHPSVSACGRFVVSDTYPDRRRLQRLLMFDLSEQRVTEIARVRVPASFRGIYRCDFHPRTCAVDGSRVCFDSAHSGVRSLYFTTVPAPAQTTVGSL